MCVSHCWRRVCVKKHENNGWSWSPLASSVSTLWLLCPVSCPQTRRGFDVDGWRAHLDALTWPEVARQLATAAGLGRQRPKPRKEERAKMGQEGEDVVQDDGGERAVGCVVGGLCNGGC